MLIKEFCEGDSVIRAGIVIRYRNYVLTGHPSPSVKYPNPLLDLFKGHLRSDETPLQGAIRECYEKSGIKFESRKLEKPILLNYDGSPLYLFLATINEMIPTAKLKCLTTFVDQDGITKLECDGFYWINPYTQIHLVQPRLHVGIMYYFNKYRYTEGLVDEDCQISGSLGLPPSNINTTISLGYKSSQVLTFPKKKAVTHGYDSIPHF